MLFIINHAKLLFWCSFELLWNSLFLTGYIPWIYEYKLPYLSIVLHLCKGPCMFNLCPIKTRFLTYVEYEVAAALIFGILKKICVSCKCANWLRNKSASSKTINYCSKDDVVSKHSFMMSLSLCRISYTLLAFYNLMWKSAICSHWAITWLIFVE